MKATGPEALWEEEGAPEEQIYEGTAEEAGRLDIFCARLSGETRSRMQQVISDGCVTVNGAAARAGLKLRPGDRVRVRMEPPAQIALMAEDIPVSIVYEDRDIAVVDKPQGMVVHPAPGNERGTLVNALLFCLRDLSGVGGELRPGIVHRIDKMTSGLLVVAKNDMAHNALAAQIKAHTARRVYVALVEGNLREDAGVVDAPVGRHPKERKRMAVTADGRAAVTHWRVLWRFERYTLIRARLETGRTHQIRVHMAHIGHPVCGDTVYGRARPELGLPGQALHACRLYLTHPRTGEPMRFSAPLPDWFASALGKAGYRGEDAREWLEGLLLEDSDA